MGGEENQSFQQTMFKFNWASDKKKDDDEYCGSMESSSIGELSSSLSSSSLEELTDDASSSNSSCSSGPLFELADLMSQLPKRGLSKFYHGRSQTFGSLANVRSVEDLGKKESSYSQRMKACKSYGGNLNRHKFGPKATITKKSPGVRRSFSPPLVAKSAIIVD